MTRSTIAYCINTIMTEGVFTDDYGEDIEPEQFESPLTEDDDRLTDEICQEFVKAIANDENEFKNAYEMLRTFETTFSRKIIAKLS